MAIGADLKVFGGCFIIGLFCFGGKVTGHLKIPVQYEKEVVNYILTNYSTFYRPVQSNARAISIFFDLQLQRIVSLDFKEQILLTTVLLTLSWFDPQLAWKTANYNGTTAVNLEPTSIWTPDVVLYNTADRESRSHTDLYKSRIRVQYTGDVRWTSSVTLASSCTVSVLMFPFDNQKCSLTFGSWSYPKPQLELKLKSKPSNKKDILKDQYVVDNGEWFFDDLSVQQKYQKYTCCFEPYSVITYTVSLRRRPLYYLLYLILPCLTLSSIFLLAFFIPHASGERIGFGVTMLLSMSVYLIVIADRLPEKSDSSPLIGILYVLFFYVMSFGLTASTITLNLAYKKTNPPEWLKKRFLKSHSNTDRTSVEPMNTQSEDDVIELGTRVPKTDAESSSPQLRNRKKSGSRRPSKLSNISREDLLEINNEQWIEIATNIDKLLSITFALMLLVIPSLVILAFHLKSQ